MKIKFSKKTSRLDWWRSFPLIVAFLVSGIPIGTDIFFPNSLFYEQKDFAVNHSIYSIFFWGGLYFVATIILFKSPITLINITKRNFILLILLLLGFFSALWSPYPTKTLVNSTHNIGLAFIALIASIRYAREPWNFVSHVSIFLGINQILHLLAIIIFPDNLVIFSGRWMGLTTHPNTLGSFSFLTIWANTSVLVNKVNHNRKIHFFLLTIAIVNLIGTNSITSTMISIIAVSGVFIFNSIYRSSSIKNNWKFIILYFLFCLILFFIITIKYEDLTTFFMKLVGRETHLTGRIFIWKEFWRFFIEKPIFGHGFGGLFRIVNNSWVGHPIYFNPHNGFFDILLKGGIISFVMFISIFYRMLVNFNFLAKWDFFTISLLAPFIFSFVLINLTETSILGPRNTVWFVFLTCIFLVDIRKAYIKQK